MPIESNLNDDLVLSGIEGCYRITFYGTLFVPYINGNGFLPKQSKVSGLVKRKGYSKYISRGLGSSFFIKALEFSLFNDKYLVIFNICIN